MLAVISPVAALTIVCIPVLVVAPAVLGSLDCELMPPDVETTAFPPVVVFAGLVEVMLAAGKLDVVEDATTADETNVAAPAFNQGATTH